MSQRVSDERLAANLAYYDAVGDGGLHARHLSVGIECGALARDLRDARAEIARLREAEAAAYLRGFEDARKQMKDCPHLCSDGNCPHDRRIRALHPGGPND